ncbi:AAA family ATPase [Moraxella sp. VT-16-12]|uniref:AAA family ATPase n=1 Tax=Moraxella sp. VT-16-12 TaxID=2014877 RepID=UPI000B800A82|nr:AAA family ATPase [Moraxella sp. VT-16-12]TWV84736.1 AAA family ATPase [Moraxella sp. VT-16-12]
MKAKLIALQNQLAHGLINRQDAIKSALLTLIAGENIVLVGPPGTGKSMIARRMSQALAPSDNHDYFEYLLTKFSTPEEIFGPLSISELKQDRFVRNTDGYLPTSNVVFLDEIFKASSSILNALLTVLNERKYHNGTHTQDIPLQTLVAASNELPNNQAELSALYDRFLVRQLVDYIDDDAIGQLFDLPSPQSVDNTHRLSKDELDNIRQKAHDVTFPDDVQTAIKNIWHKHKQAFTDNSDEWLSDRKLVKVLHLMRISAITNGRDTVDLSDVMLLKDCLWNNPDNIATVRNIIVQELGVSGQSTPNRTNTAKPTPASNASYQGSGTKDDPIIISNLNELMGLKNPDIGQQGYYFKQTADIDCPTVTKWKNMDFKGHYDGQGFSIINYNTKYRYLFNVVSDSTIQRINAVNFGIAKELNNSTISNCKNTLQDTNMGGDFAGFAFKASDSTIEQCFISGSITEVYSESTIEFSGFIYNGSTSTVTRCALGNIKATNVEHYDYYPIKEMKNSISISTNELYVRDDSPWRSGYYLEEVEPNRFNLYCFEDNLGWNFDDIWDWDDSKNEPVLQKTTQSIQSHTPNQVATMPNPKQNTPLQQQLNNNIWL